MPHQDAAGAAGAGPAAGCGDHVFLVVRNTNNMEHSWCVLHPNSTTIFSRPSRLWLQWHTLAFEPPKKDYTPFLGWLVDVCGRCRDYIVECESIHMHLSCQHLSIVITFWQVSPIVGRIFWSLNRLGARPGDPQTWDVSPDCETETQRSRPSAAQTLVGGRSRAPSWLAYWGSSERSNQTMHLHSPPNI